MREIHTKIEPLDPAEAVRVTIETPDGVVTRYSLDPRTSTLEETFDTCWLLGKPHHTRRKQIILSGDVVPDGEGHHMVIQAPDSATIPGK